MQEYLTRNIIFSSLCKEYRVEQLLLMDLIFHKVEKRVVIYMLVQRVQNTVRAMIVLYLHWSLW